MQLIAFGMELAVLRQAWRRRNWSSRCWRNAWRKRKLEGSMCIWDDNIKMYLKYKSFGFST